MNKKRFKMFYGNYSKDSLKYFAEGRARKERERMEDSYAGLPLGRVIFN